MRRDQLIHAINNLVGALKAAKVHETVLAATRAAGTKENLSRAELFRSYAHFMTAYADFGEDERYLLSIFGLEPIVTPEFWEKLSRDQGSSGLTIRRGLSFSIDFLPTIAGMIERESDRTNVTFQDPSDPSQTVETERIRFYVRDPGVPTLTLKHFSTILKSIEDLHSSIETIENLKHSDLVVASLDSGSDKEFDLLGIASAVKKLSETLLEVWNRIQSAKAVKAKVNYGAACEGIAVLVKLHAAEKNNAIPKEQAESIRRTITSSIAELFENGVYTDAMEGQIVPPPSALPIDRRKLLTHEPKKTTAGELAASDGEPEVPEEE
jgi:hypothetical protein